MFVKQVSFSRSILIWLYKIVSTFFFCRSRCKNLFIFLSSMSAVLLEMHSIHEYCYLMKYLKNVCFLVWKVWGICLRVWEGNVREGPVLQPDHCALGSHFCSSLFIDVKFSNKCHKQMAYFQGVVGTNISAAFQPISPNY